MKGVGGVHKGTCQPEEPRPMPGIGINSSIGEDWSVSDSGRKRTHCCSRKKTGTVWP